MFDDDLQPEAANDPTCAACAGASGHPYHGDVWGHPLCASCRGAWNADPAVKAISARWQELNLDTAGLYMAATKAFIQARRKAAA